MTRRDYQCPHCKKILEVKIPLSQEGPDHLHCPEDEALMRRYFGNIREVPINYGFRPHRYLNIDDERIAQYQFENL